jgi:ribosomal protein S20
MQPTKTRKGWVEVMNAKTKVWVSVGLASAMLAAAGSAFAASTDSSANQQQQAQQQNVHHGQKGWQGGFAKNQQLLSLLKTDSQTLINELKAGKSLADVASAHGVSEQQVIDLLTSQESQEIDQAVQAGKITSDKASKMKAKLSDRIKQMVERKGFAQKESHGPLNEIASILGLSQQDLKSQLQAGKSVKQIAEEKGISEQQLIDQLLQKEKERLTQLVEKTDWKQAGDKDHTSTNGQEESAQQN